MNNMMGGNTNNIANDALRRLSLQVPSRLTGALIGKGGEAIAGLQQRSGTKITFGSKDEHQNSSTRSAIVIGTSAQIDAAVSDMGAVLDEAWKAAFFKNNPAAAANAEPTLLELKVYIPSNMCGALIGKNGATIKELNTKFEGTHISVDNQVLGASREVTITGLPSNVLKAQKEIEERLSPMAQTLGMTQGVLADFHTANLRAGIVIPGQVAYGNTGFSSFGGGVGGSHLGGGQQTTVTLRVPNQAAGLLIGRNGGVIRELQEISMTKIVLDREVDAEDFRKVTITGDANLVKNAQTLIAQRIGLTTLTNPGAQNQGAMYHGGMGAGSSFQQGGFTGLTPPGIPPGMPGLQNNYYGNPAAGLELKETIRVPTSAIGFIVGKKGAAINEIKRMSNCQIIVRSSPETANNPETEVQITGTQGGIYHATTLIHSKVEQMKQYQPQIQPGGASGL